jgi:predicted transcriptional regulator of viral defense system
MAKKTQKTRALQLVKARGILRPKDLVARGIPKARLQSLLKEGSVIRLARGLYAANDAEMTEWHSLAEASKRVPSGIICLLSALQYHGLTTQLPHKVWIALGPSAWKPIGHGLPLEFVRFSGRALTEGVELHTIEGVKVRVTSPARTVADCFKYRNKVGQDVALEALRDAWRHKKATMDDFWHYAAVCRVAKVMRPYMESLV